MNEGRSAKRVAVLVEDGFEERELRETVERLRAGGAEVVIVGAAVGHEYRGRHGEATVVADARAGGAKAREFDAVVIPGGYAPDRMRLRHAMVDLVRDAAGAGIPVAAISYGPQVLISAGALRGRTVTCWPSIAIDVKNAGGRYVDRPVVRDGPIITARKADDLEAFTTAILEAISSSRA
jgi:protease I